MLCNLRPVFSYPLTKHTYIFSRIASIKYPQHMFLGLLNTVWLNISNFPFHFDLSIHSIQIFVITSFVIILHVGIKRIGCI